MTALRVMLADDELQARKRVARLLEAMPDVAVVGVCASAEEVLAQLPQARPDLLLLDISMPGLSGLDAHALVAGCPDAPAVVFVTAHDHHAVAAFDVGAADYVLKPVTAARLAKAIARVRDARRAPASVDRIAVDTRKGVRLIDPADIVCAQFDGSLVTIVTTTDSCITTLGLGQLADRLPSTFERVDRRHLLNLTHVTHLERRDTGGYNAITRSGHTIPVSRAVGRALRRRLGF